MHPLDIISDSPNFFILQKETNKTNLGGFLISIYSIIILAIGIFYSIKYKNSESYNIQSLIHFNLKSQEQKKEKMKSELFNPTNRFRIDLTHYNDTNLNDKFKLYDKKEDNFINKSCIFERNLSEFEIHVVYECEVFNCSDYLDYINNSEPYYYLETIYEGFRLEHQNKDEPIQKKYKGKDGKTNEYYFGYYDRLQYNYTYSLIYNWRTILYKEKKFFEDDYNKSCGYIEYSDLFYSSNIKLTDIKGKPYVILNIITINSIITEYLEYIRISNTILDLFGIIGSYISNIFFIARMIFKYYSKNFNNFKVIEKIMSDRRQNYMNHNKSDKPFNEFLDIENIKNKKKSDLKNFMPLIDDNKINEESIKDIKDFEDIGENDIDEIRQLRKLHFFDFFLNNLYINRICKKQKAQRIINGCNKILHKYASIDTIVYNQMLIENLVKDYKWNDPSLNNVENNSLFIELKTYL